MRKQQIRIWDNPAGLEVPKAAAHMQRRTAVGILEVNVSAMFQGFYHLRLRASVWNNRPVRQKGAEID